tara:strand:+ start:165 stop:494 length:330 start_codon:yes stop_codon:yes gene_type:complete
MNGSSIDFTEVRIFSFYDESSINPYILQKKASYGIRHGFSYQMFEMAAFCLFSILSDTGIIWIDYSPQNKPIGFKSLKYFFNSLSNVEIFQEYVKSWLCNGLNPLLDPE